MELTQILLLLLIVGEFAIVFIMLIVYRILRKYVEKIHQILEANKFNNVSNRDITTYLSKILDTLYLIKSSIKTYKESEITSIPSNNLGRPRELTADEKNIIVELDINDPSVRQWYEYLKKHAEELKKRKLQEGSA